MYINKHGIMSFCQIHNTQRITKKRDCKPLFPLWSLNNSSSTIEDMYYLINVIQYHNIIYYLSQENERHKL